MDINIQKQRDNKDKILSVNIFLWLLGIFKITLPEVIVELSYHCFAPLPG